MAMAPSLPRSGFTSSPFLRRLAQLSGSPTAVAPQTFAERLSPWLDWTDAIALSAALGDTSLAPPVATGQVSGAPALAVQQALDRLRSEIAQAVADDSLFGHAAPPPDEAADLAACRRQYAAQQRLMAERIGPLRARVRAVLARQSPALARLAALDQVMHEALDARERHLLAKVPQMLVHRFERARTGPPAAWAAFCLDLQQLLLAELEIRLQPLEGMMEALQPPPGASA